jgi:membrane-associated protein
MGSPSDLLAIILAHPFEYYFRNYGYIGIYFWFVGVDQLSPIPEEISLITIGYLASQGYINPLLAGLISIVAFFTIDLIYFYLTKSGSKLLAKITKRARNSQSGNRYSEGLQKNMFVTLLIISFIPRVRLFAPVYVALANQPLPKFLLYSMSCLSIFTAIYIGLGMLFHRSLSTLIAKTQTTGHIIFIAAMVVLTVGMTIFAVKKLK